MLAGAVGRPGAPFRPLDLDVEHYLWFVEALVRETGDANSAALDDLYSASRAPAAPPANRASAIEAFLGGYGD